MPIIEVNHVTKQFRLGQMHSLTLSVRRMMARLSGAPLPERQNFNALDDVNFSVEEGEVVGIIGSNGAGKSTLLKILSQITVPSSGSVNVRAKVAPLIEVGAGLIGDLTGRENIYLNGAILGMSRREISRKFDEIVEFSELEKFLDTPVKRYSSGMSVRLGFSIATTVDAGILIVDEVLAVGDLAFQRKCFDRMEDLIKRQKRTVLLVSHNVRQVERLCTRAILLDQGRIVADGAATETCNLFYERSDAKIAQNSAVVQERERMREHVTSGEVELVRAAMLDHCGKPIDVIPYKSDVTVVLTFKVNVALKRVVFGLGVHTPDFVYLVTDHSDDSMEPVDIKPGLFDVRCAIRRFPFLPGVYALRFLMSSGELAKPVFYSDNVFFFRVTQKAGRVQRTQDGLISWDAEWSGAARNDAASTSLQVGEGMSAIDGDGQYRKQLAG